MRRSSVVVRVRAAAGAALACLAWLGLAGCGQKGALIAPAPAASASLAAPAPVGPATR